MSITKREAIDLLGRVTELELVQLLAFKAAGSLAAGGPSMTLVAHGVAPGGPTAVVRVRITKKREPKPPKRRVVLCGGGMP